ncbi:MAG TPA: hydroxymethylbilane synthase [Microbacteriaceae bacterium]|nr:hydroxymethylbilane synthase [Microbacteriaceae bacterium]
MPSLRVGTRGSLLALTQTRTFTTALTDRWPGLELSETLIRTEGDVSTEPLSTSTTPGLFVGALRQALLCGEVDVIVHSMKDLPAAAHPDIATACIPEREDPRDVLVSRNNLRLSELPSGARVGTCSPRRAASIRALRPDLTIDHIRGNIDSRIAKVERGDYDATVLARAGLNRIGRADVAAEVFSATDWIPAAGQGALAIECRADDEATRALLAELDDIETRLTTAAERHVLVGLAAGCSTAIGAFAVLDDSGLTLTAELAVEATGAAVRVVDHEPNVNLERARKLGLRVATKLRNSPIAREAAWT